MAIAAPASRQGQPRSELYIKGDPGLGRSWSSPMAEPLPNCRLVSTMGILVLLAM